MFNTISLDNAAKEYIVNCLQQGNTYASVLARSPLKRVTAFLPDEIDYSHFNYSRSIYLTYGVRIYDATRSNIYETVRKFLQGGNARYALIETYYRSSDLEKIAPLPRILYSENEIYFLLKPNQGVQEIQIAFSSARDYPFVCGLIELSGMDLTLTDGQAILPSWWDILARKTQHVIVNAFDDEGFLLSDVEY